MNTARLEELILEDSRVPWAVTHSTVMKNWKWMFVDWLCMYKPDFLRDIIFRRFLLVPTSACYLLHVRPSVGVYRVSQEEWTKFRESVPYVKIYRYNPKHLYPKLNGYGDNGHRKVRASGVSTYCKPSVTPYSSIAHARQRDIVMQ